MSGIQAKSREQKVYWGHFFNGPTLHIAPCDGEGYILVS